jgi:hypothetical protein
MFRFQSFHMYGILGTAVITGMLLLYLFRKYGVKDISGTPITCSKKQSCVLRYLAGGSIFGLGWALTGACPGPMFVNMGYGYLSMGIVILAAIAGTFLYGLMMKRLPH